MRLAVTKDGGRKSRGGVAARKKQGGSSPVLKVKEWDKNSNHTLDHRLRTELITSDFTEEKSFTFVASQYLSDCGVDLREESKTQVSYYLHMEKFL